MRVMLDHCTPAPIRHHLPDHQVSTAALMSWQRHQNGDLIAAAEAAGFDTFLTADQSIPYQVNMQSRNIAIVVVTSNHGPSVIAQAQVISDAIHNTEPGQISTVITPRLRRS